MIAQELYAFWRYDRYPYCLGGIVSSFKDDLAYIPSYQSYFKPFLITTKEYGEQLKLKLDILKNNRNAELKEIKDKYDRELKTLIRLPVNP